MMKICARTDCPSYHEKEDDHCTTNRYATDCPIYKPLKSKTDAGAKLACSDGLSVLLQDAKDQYRWFDANFKEKGISGIAKHYRTGSRDAYSYMISAIEAEINR